jgi:hypothetical protein
MIIRGRKKKCLYFWHAENQLAIQEKKLAYVKWLQTKTQEDHKAAKAKRAVKIAHQKNLDSCISNIGNYVYGRQLNVYKLMKHLDSENKDVADIQVIGGKEWITYFKKQFLLQK